MWTTGPENRLINWRNFREDISKLSDEEAIKETALLWSKAPISNQYLAPDLIEDWPDPWELIHYNHYDDISITLGMVYTLVLASDKFNDVIIYVLKDINNQNILHTAWFQDGKYILNYEYNEVVSIGDLSSDLKIKYKYSYQDLHIDKYK